MNIRTDLLENCANFVDTTRKQNAYFKIIICVFVNIYLSVYIFFLLYKYVNDGNFFLEQITETGNLDAIFILRQFKLDVLSRFKAIKSANPKTKHDQIRKESGCSTGSLQRYRQDVDMVSP